MDSLLVMALAAARGDELACLHVNYGQRTEKKEKESFEKICDFYRVKPENRKQLNLPQLGQLGGSSLTDKKINITNTLGNMNQDIPMTYVPFRNSIMLSLATAWAEVINFNRIQIGAVHEDSSGYPDCRPEYYEIFNQLIEKGTKSKKIFVETPIIKMNKPEIILKALELKAPLELTWSCYQGTQAPCEVCDSCVLRSRAFKSLRINDPF